MKRVTAQRVSRGMMSAVWVIALCAWSGLAHAQQPETTLLITEVTKSAETGTEPATQFWWANLERPSWSVMDIALRESLKAQGVTWSTTSGQGKNISKIYLRPNLARENATTLAGLLGAQRVYYGSIVYEPVVMPPTSTQKGVRVWVSLELVDVRTKVADEVQLVMERVVFDASEKRATELARKDVVEALSQVMARHVSMATGPLGPAAAEERWIILKGAQDGRHVELARRRIEALAEVKTVQVAWSAAGYIAFEVNPGEQDAPSVLERVQRTLSESQEHLDSGEAWRWKLSSDTTLAGGIVMEPVASQPLEREERGD